MMVQSTPFAAWVAAVAVHKNSRFINSYAFARCYMPYAAFLRLANSVCHGVIVLSRAVSDVLSSINLEVHVERYFFCQRTSLQIDAVGRCDMDD